MNRLAVRCLVGLLLLSGCTPRAGVVEVDVEGDPSLMSLPDFYPGDAKFRCDPYLRAAVRLQGLGRAAAVAALRALAKEERGSDGHRAVLLCRMLFTKKAGGEFRRPLLGVASFLGGDSPDWPLEPIEVVDGVPFLIVYGYSLDGLAESGQHYLSYCVADCEWNGVPYRVKSEAEKAKALEKLTDSPKWKGLLGGYDKSYLAEQVK